MSESRPQPTVAAIVLAAGESRRMGRPKLLLPWGDTTVLGQTLRHVRAARVTPVVVVTGHLAEPIAELARAAGCAVCHNPAYAAGEMLSSLQAGLRCLPAEACGALVVLGDQPLVTAATLNAIVDVFEENRGEIIVPVFQGQAGNPVLIGRISWPELLALPAGSRPRALLERQPNAVYHLTVDTEAILIDLDDPASYARWRPS